MALLYFVKDKKKIVYHFIKKLKVKLAVLFFHLILEFVSDFDIRI